MTSTNQEPRLLCGADQESYHQDKNVLLKLVPADIRGYKAHESPHKHFVLDSLCSGYDYSTELITSFIIDSVKKILLVS